MENQRKQQKNQRKPMNKNTDNQNTTNEQLFRIKK